MGCMLEREAAPPPSWQREKEQHHRHNRHHEPPMVAFGWKAQASLPKIEIEVDVHDADRAEEKEEEREIKPDGDGGGAEKPPHHEPLAVASSWKAQVSLPKIETGVDVHDADRAKEEEERDVKPDGGDGGAEKPPHHEPPAIASGWKAQASLPKIETGVDVHDTDRAKEKEEEREVKPDGDGGGAEKPPHHELPMVASGWKAQASLPKIETGVDVHDADRAEEKEEEREVKPDGGGGGAEKPLRRERRRSRMDPQLSNLPKGIQGEQVIAGWPAWLSAIIGEAIRGWTPCWANSFKKLDKAILLLLIPFFLFNPMVSFFVFYIKLAF